MGIVAKVKGVRIHSLAGGGGLPRQPRAAQSIRVFL